MLADSSCNGWRRPCFSEAARLWPTSVRDWLLGRHDAVAMQRVELELPNQRPLWKHLRHHSARLKAPTPELSSVHRGCLCRADVLAGNDDGPIGQHHGRGAVSTRVQWIWAELSILLPRNIFRKATPGPFLPGSWLWLWLWSLRARLMERNIEDLFAGCFDATRCRQ